MSALTAARNTFRMGDAAVPNLLNYPVKAGVKIQQGGLVVLNAGYLAPMTVATGLIAVGEALETVDNTAGSNGDKICQVRAGVMKWGNSSAGDLIGVTEIGKTCYGVDDQTVAKTDATGTRSAAGTVVQVDTDGVWVATHF